MVDCEPQDHDIEGAVATLGGDDAEEEDSDSDTVSTGVGCEDDLSTDSAVQNLGLPIARSSDVKPSFGNIAVTNSTGVHFGNKTFYNGPVTIKQIVYATGAEDSVAGGSSSRSQEGTALTYPESNDLELPAQQALVGPHVVGEEFKPNEIALQINGSSYPLSQQIKQTDGSGRPIAVKWVQHLQKPVRLALLVGVIGTLFVLITALVVWLATRESPSINEERNSPNEFLTPPSQGEEDFNCTVHPKLRIIERRDWLASPPVDPPTPLEHPVPYVIISHSATEQCHTQSTCTLAMKKIQDFHVDGNGWSDIGYNFAVGGDGYAYEGRGWDIVGAHTQCCNKKAIGINFIGTFNDVLPPKCQQTAAKRLIQLGVDLGKIAPDYKLFAHRQLSPTVSPGMTFAAELKTWPHWSESL